MFGKSEIQRNKQNYKESAKIIKKQSMNERVVEKKRLNQLQHFYCLRLWTWRKCYNLREKCIFEI
jgi:hypothetical protein